MKVEDVNFWLQVRGGHAALVEDPATAVAKMLRKVADDLDAGADHGRIRDDNGNTVGDWSLDLDGVEAE